MPGRAGGRYAQPGAREPTLSRGPELAGATYLPKEGRQGEPPAWPLNEQSEREQELWKRLWATPVAVAWETMGWQDVVARYARVLAEAEMPLVDGHDIDWHMVSARERAITGARAEARQLEDRLGLNPISMLRLRWVIGDFKATLADQPSAENVRERLRLA